MNRKLANALTSVALAAFVAVAAGLTAAQTQDEAAPARTGRKMSKAVATSCPVHPEVKARRAGRCPKCRMEERKQKGAKEKNKNKVQPQQQEAAPDNG